MFCNYCRSNTKLPLCGACELDYIASTDSLMAIEEHIKLLEQKLDNINREIELLRQCALASRRRSNQPNNEE